MAFKSTHKEALAAAQEAWFDNPIGDENIDMDAAIRAYLEARGARIVPHVPTENMEMAARQAMANGRLVGGVLRSAIEAAPDPFTDEVAG